MVSIGDVAYWDKRYEDEQTRKIGFQNFDWYCPFNKIYSTISSLVDVTGTHKILVIG